MKKLIAVAAAAMLLCLLLSVAVSAQYEEDQSTKLNLKIGFFKPTGSLLPGISKNWSVQELTYDFKRDEAGRPTVQANAGLMQTINSSSASMLKVGVDRFYWTAARGESSLYYGLGAGLYKMKVFSEKELNAGGELFVGYNFRDAYMLEVRGLAVRPITLGTGTSAVDVNLSGVMICASTRKLF